MRAFTKILASSVFASSATGSLSTATVSSTAQFSGPAAGALGGPLSIQFGTGISMQALIGGTGNASSSISGGTFSILGSNVLEPSMFQVIATTTVSSTGSWLLRDSAPWYRFVDFRYTPVVTSSSAILTVVYHEKGNG